MEEHFPIHSEADIALTPKPDKHFTRKENHGLISLMKIDVKIDNLKRYKCKNLNLTVLEQQRMNK